MKIPIVKSIYQDNTACLIEYFKIDTKTGHIYGKVRYFPLQHNDFEWDKHTVLDTKFFISKDDFLNQFRKLENPEEAETDKTFEGAVWSKITEEDIDFLERIKGAL